MFNQVIFFIIMGALVLFIGSCQQSNDRKIKKSENSENINNKESRSQKYQKNKTRNANSSMGGFPKTVKKTNVKISSVDKELLEIKSTFVGYLIPNERVKMTSEMEGVIENINFEEVDEIKTGQKLINISTKELTLRLKISEANLKLARTNLNRDENLYKRKLIPQSKIDLTRNQADRSALDRDLALINLKKSFILSPLKGTVKTRHVKVGEFVRKGDSLLEILDLEKVLVKVNIPEQDIMEIREGEKVNIELYALSDRQYQGKVQTIGLEADSRNRTFPIEITVDNAKRELRPGMLARVTFTKNISEKQIVVPRNSILERDDGRIVFLINDKKALKRFVVTGQSMKDRVQILEGLKTGDLIVVEGHNKLTDGESVNIIQ
jgi:membrane fusion protein, multidrug efflux system